ncbi:hypothetical protein K7432_006063 [Basidiobolus ranarum]|uniref:Uncharacterized protein n=1 Tax=Basidiobolus ranarum TaxID=34480 RepID=A0ABR2W264_9FUNG
MLLTTHPKGMSLETVTKPLPVSLEEYLNCVSTPTFVLEFLQQPLINSLTPVLHANTTIKNLCGIDQCYTSDPYINLQQLIAQQDIPDFGNWIRQISCDANTKPIITHLKTRTSSYIEPNITQENTKNLLNVGSPVEWTSTCVQNSIIVLSGTLLETLPMEDDSLGPNSEVSTITLHEDKQKEYEDTSWKNSSELVDSLSGGGAMGEYLRNYNWKDTCLGPISQWPQSLLTAVSICLTSSFPMSLWWGPKFILIYNDAYRVVAGKKHPWLFGKEGAVGWNELWPGLELLAQCGMRGENCYLKDDLLLMFRNGYTEETYYTWSYIPIKQEDGSVGGLLNPSTESTNQVISERRLKTLRDLSSMTAGAKCCHEVFHLIGNSLLGNPYDIPFALFYSGIGYKVTEKEDNLPEDGTLKFELVEKVGFVTDHAAAPKEILLSESDYGHPWKEYIREAIARKTIIPIYDIEEMFVNLPARGWDEPPTMAVACPIVGSDQESVLGVAIVGLNPKRPYDEDYRTFIELLSRQSGTALATVRAYEQQVERAEALAAIDRAKTTFFSSVSHELRTPLALILGPIQEMLSDKSISSVQKANLDMMLRNSKRLLKLVNSLLDFSRIEAGRVQATYRETDLGKVTADLASVFRSAIEKGGLEFEVKCNENERPVWVDIEMWEKIVFNLIGNAFKFTLKGSIRVNLRPSPDRTCAILTVSDTGSGIPSHETTRVFDRFYRAEGQRGRSHEGTGIGLSLTQELVRLHGGTIELESQFGIGSSFIVSIPYGSAHLPQELLLESAMESDGSQEMTNTWAYGLSVVEEARFWMFEDNEDPDYVSTSSSASSSNSSGNSFPMSSRGSRILLVDDNPDMRRYIKGLLSRWWQVTEAGNGEDAFNLAIQNPPDLIISDVMMPVLDGIGLLKIIRTHSNTKFVPVILLSAKAGEEAKLEGLEAGADDFLTKPFSSKELVARAHTHLELGKLRSELERIVKERTIKLSESELRYKALAKLCPVGIFRLDLNGHITYTNDKWWEISGHDQRKDPSALSFISSIHPEDRERAAEMFTHCIKMAQGFSIEFRWSSATGIRWCLGEVIVEYDNQAQPFGFVGTLTDLTDRKKLEKERLSALQLAERQQRRRAEDAEEIKKQQELFIDMTCHELRNPLNGIYHNADFLSESLEKVQRDLQAESTIKVMKWLNDEIENDLDAVATISLCAQHQKKIADDVLNMSKINMNLLVLVRTNLQPHAIVTDILRMFETEVKLKKIGMKFIIGEEYSKMNINWVKGDPTRLSQVLINFLTNAIRFTEKVSLRQITITLEAFESPPYSSIQFENNNNEMEFSDQDTDAISICSSVSSTGTVQHIHNYTPVDRSKPQQDGYFDLTSSNTVYIEISIRDSGVGMTPEEQASLFRRFTQVSPKTYAEFGGSGLGLFISKRLVELHGGSIKVSSVKGDGTTFSFFIQCERLSDEETLQAEKKAKDSYDEDKKRLTKELSKKIEKVSAKQSLSVEGKKLAVKKSISAKKLKPQQTLSIEPSKDSKKILVVEDNLINQRVLKRHLEMAQYTVDVAKHGLEALEIMKKKDFALIVMDLEMPVMGGLECTQQIRRLETESGSSAVPIIGVSGNARTEYKKLAIEAGMTAYITKPYNKNELLQMVSCLVDAGSTVPMEIRAQ